MQWAATFISLPVQLPSLQLQRFVEAMQQLLGGDEGQSCWHELPESTLPVLVVARQQLQLQLATCELTEDCCCMPVMY